MTDETYNFLDWNDREPRSENPPRSQNRDLDLLAKTLGIQFFTDRDLNDEGTFNTVIRKCHQEVRPVMATRNGPLIKVHAIPFTSANTPEEAETRMADLLFNYAVTVQTPTHVFAMPQHNSKDELKMTLSIIKDATWRAIERRNSTKTP